MAYILSLIHEDYSNLHEILTPYNESIKEAVKSIDLKGHSLQEALTKQPSMLSYYDEQRIQLNSLSKYITMDVIKVRGSLFREYTENHSRELSDRAKEKYIDFEPRYMFIKQIHIEVDEVLNQMERVCDAFRNQGFTLANLTKLKIAELPDVIL